MQLSAGPLAKAASVTETWLTIMKTVAIVLTAVCLAFLASLSPARAEDPKQPPTAPAKAAFKNVNVEEFEKMRAVKDTVVLDVRTKSEFEAGHVPGAVNLDVKSPDFEAKAAKLDKSKTYLVHCAAGVRSVNACNKMAPLKIEKLFNLEGGFKAWEKAGHKAEK
jgi:rhodanese-related sulfurtransferase